MNNGILKFNMVGLPYNYKKLLKRPNFSGHVNYSAPEFIHERSDFRENSDTWSLGCCLYYLVTKMDPFEGRSVPETKKNILTLRLDRHNGLAQHDKIFHTLIYKCLERDPSRRITPAQLLQFQDDIEQQLFGVTLSRQHSELLVERARIVDSLGERVRQDRVEVDYSGQSLNLRNNAWFFSKMYTVAPLLDDTDFYSVIENGAQTANPDRIPSSQRRKDLPKALPKRLPAQFQMKNVQSKPTPTEPLSKRLALANANNNASANDSHGEFSHMMASSQPFNPSAQPFTMDAPPQQQDGTHFVTRMNYGGNQEMRAPRNQQAFHQ